MTQRKPDPRKEIREWKVADPWERAMDELFEADNHRDPEQHIAVMRLSGRRLSRRTGHQDYWRTQKAQRESKNRYFAPERQDSRPNAEVGPEAVEEPAIARADSDAIRLTITKNQYRAIELVFGHEYSVEDAATKMGMSAKRLRQLVRRGLWDAAWKAIRPRA